jgi:hypothetical protein
MNWLGGRERGWQVFFNVRLVASEECLMQYLIDTEGDACIESLR